MMISGLIWILSVRQQRRAHENRCENESYPRYFDFDHHGLVLLKLRGKIKNLLRHQNPSGSAEIVRDYRRAFISRQLRMLAL